MSWNDGSSSARVRTKSEHDRYLDADLMAHGISAWRLQLRLSRPQLYFQRVLRKCEFLVGRRDPLSRALYVFNRVRLARLSQRLGMSIPMGVFGPGLSIAHYGTIVVNDQARVGQFCRLHVGTTIGERNGAAPHIGNFVYIGPGAVIYGGVTVGDRAVIAANAVVGRDVAAGEIVAGSPARVISDRGSADVMPSSIKALMGHSCPG